MKEDIKKFRRPDVWRPPSERNSYFLPLTGGCSNNTCTFCNFYGIRLRIRGHEEVKTEIDALALFVEQGTVLADVDQLVYIICSALGPKANLSAGWRCTCLSLSKTYRYIRTLEQEVPGS